MSDTITITREQAKALAVRYEAYMAAINRDDGAGIRVWGPALIEIQETTGVQMLRPDLIRRTCMTEE